MKRNRVFLRSAAAALALALTLAAGCSKSNGNPGGQTDKETVKLTLWGAADDQIMLNQMVENFRKTDTDVNYDITLRVAGEDVAKDEALKDIDAAADVFSISHDQLGSLVDAGAVYENTKYAESIARDQSEAADLAAQYKGKYYGYPYSVETYVLYYDTSKLSAEDVTSIEGILRKTQDSGVAKLGYDFSDAYFSSAFFFGNGCTLFGENGDDASSMTFNTPAGVEAGNYIAGLRNKGVVNLDSDTAGTQFKSGKLAAMVSGPWKTSSYKEALGDRYGVAVLPTATFSSGTRQLMPFAGLKMYVVNAKTESPLHAMKLAAFLTNKENQEKRFSDRALLPTNQTVAEDSSVTDDPTVAVILKQVEHAKVMPALSRMSHFWDPTAAFTKDAFDGKISAENMQKKLDQLVSDVTG